jgi:hypothetical protein
MSDGDETGSQISVGTVPVGFPDSLRPSNAAVVGGQRTSWRVTAVFADSTRPLAPLIDSLIQRAGFRRPPLKQEPGFAAGFGGTGPYCRNGATISVTQLVGNDRHLARVDYNPPRGATCEQMNGRAETRELVIPGLIAPPGVRVVTGGGGRGSDGVNSRAEMTGTRIVPATILKHYADQLTAAGWVANPPALSDRVAAQFFEATAPDGGRWEGVLQVMGGGSAASLSLNMRRAR